MMLRTRWWIYEEEVLMEISMSPLLMVFDSTCTACLYTRELVYIRSSKTILILNIGIKLIFISTIFAFLKGTVKYYEIIKKN